MRVIFFGTPPFAVPSLERLLTAAEVDVVGVVTQPDRRRGRGSQVMPSPVKQVALEANCPIWQPQRIKRDQATLKDLAASRADVFVVVAYGQILSPAILEMPRLGCVNAHGSLLPAYRGAAPIQWCLYHGETTTGITTMRMDAGMDTGPMLLKREVTVGLLDNALDLAETLAAVSADLLLETLSGLASGRLRSVPQDAAQATYAPLIQKADFELNWSRSAIALHNQVRGFYPNAVTQFRGAPLKISATVPLSADTWGQLPAEIQALKATVEAMAPADAIADASAEPGQILGLLKHQGPVVQTGNGLLLLQRVKPQGKREQSGADFANGSRLTPGETLGSC